MRPVSVRIMHLEPGAGAGPLVRWLADAKGQLAERHRGGFLAAGATDVALVSHPPDTRSFGARLRGLGLAPADGPAGLVVLGSGAIPLATARDRRDFVAAAGAEDRRALANNRYSADIIALSRADEALAKLPDLRTDNALPRWLEEVAGYSVGDLRRRWRLGVDLDSPLDLVLTGGGGRDGAVVPPVDLRPVRDRLAAMQRMAGDRRAEILVAGRTSAATLTWLERRTASRTRALIEERGLRTGILGQRAPASVLGLLLDRDGPDSLGRHAARLADAAAIDSRVLLAHRLGADEGAWPSAEDRFASDLLRPDDIADPWLRALTASAIEAPIPVLLGGHALVGPGLRLIVTGAWGQPASQEPDPMVGGGMSGWAGTLDGWR